MDIAIYIELSMYVFVEAYWLKSHLLQKRYPFGTAHQVCRSVNNFRLSFSLVIYLYILFVFPLRRYILFDLLVLLLQLDFRYNVIWQKLIALYLSVEYITYIFELYRVPCGMKVYRYNYTYYEERVVKVCVTIITLHSY